MTIEKAKEPKVAGRSSFALGFGGDVILTKFKPNRPSNGTKWQKWLDFCRKVYLYNCKSASTGPKTRHLKVSKNKPNTDAGRKNCPPANTRRAR